nr:hypothetical protein [uncultured Cetobacterium sp.]
MKKVNEKLKNQLLNTFKQTSIVEEEKYIPLVDYNEYELDENQKGSMISLEKKVVHHVTELSKNSIELSKVLYEAQNTLAAAKTGSFVKWFESIGLKKDFVYMLLKRNELYQITNREEVFSIPEKTIKKISKAKGDISANELIEVITAIDPLEKVESYLSGHPKDKNSHIEDVEIIENPKDKIKEIEKKIAEHYKAIKDLEYELKILKNKK